MQLTSQGLVCCIGLKVALQRAAVGMLTGHEDAACLHDNGCILSVERRETAQQTTVMMAGKHISEIHDRDASSPCSQGFVLCPGPDVAIRRCRR